MSAQSRLGDMIAGQLNVKTNTGLDRPHWESSHTYPILSMMVVVEQAGVQIMKEYFEIEAS